MTSYVAFDVDDPLSNDLKDLATTDVVKTYYVTYTYLNTLIDNGSVIVRTNVSTSSDIVTEKLYLYSKRTEPVQATTPPHTIDTKPSKPFDSINIYATKTYLTTFTYFTTLLQVNSNDRHGSSTVVDSHTNIVENVITESIPNSLFPTESLSSYYSAVQTAKNSKGIVTIATLLEGQTLEVTAIAPSEPIKMSSTAASSFVDKLVDENVEDNVISDNISAESQPAAVNTRPNNKIEKIENPVSDLIGSFNLNSLTAFGPMFNALTGLIQNNFAKNSNDKNSTIVKNVRNETITIKDESGQNIVPAALGDISGRNPGNPIYIPVGGIVDDDIESAESQNKNIQLPHLNSFVPPAPPSVKWINDNGQQSQQLVIGKPSPLLSGIPISPGDVITANSDVIIGRPTVGVSPRIPLHSDLDDQLHLDPPPIQAFPHANNIRDSIPLQSIQTESYIGPPPPLQQHHQKSRLNFHKNQIHDSHRPAIIPFNNVHNDRGTAPQSHHEIRLSSSKNILSNNFLHPPPFKPQVNFAPDHQHPHKQLNIPLIQSNEHHHHPQPQFNHQKTNYQQQIYNQHQPEQQQPQIIPAIPAKSHPNISPIKEDPLFEIQRIPEVFSTDLPPIHVLEYPQHQIEPSVQVPQVSVFSPLPDIQQSTGQPLLVNIQPSQIANIIIPHGSTTALIYGGANELHKNGQYFDEPSPYIDADINLFYSNKPNKTTTNVINVDVPHNHQTHVNIQPHKPISANHEINMNANVLSQDVDLHAPPIKFTLKEENYAQHPDLNQHYDFERVNGYLEHGTEAHDNVVSSSKHEQNEHRLVVAPIPVSTTTPSDLTDLFNQQSNYVAHQYNAQDFNRQPNTYIYHSQNNGDQNLWNGNEHNVQNNSHASNSVHNGKNYYHKNPPNVDEYNGPPPRQRQRPNVVKLNEINTKSQAPPFYQHYYPQQHNVNRPTGGNIFLHQNVPQQPQSSRPKPGKIVNYEQSQHIHKNPVPVYINLHEHVDSGASNVPSVKDVVVDEHKDDDFANEEGEVIQESNSVPVVPGQKPTDVFNVQKPTSSPKTMFYEIQHPSSYSGNEIVNTQTESNYLWNVSGISNTNSGIVDNKKPIRYPSAPPAVLINELTPDNLYPPTVSPINKNRLEYGNRRRPIIPIRPLESPPLHPQHGSSGIIYGETSESGKFK